MDTTTRPRGARRRPRRLTGAHGSTRERTGAHGTRDTARQRVVGPAGRVVRRGAGGAPQPAGGAPQPAAAPEAAANLHGDLSLVVEGDEGKLPGKIPSP